MFESVRLSDGRALSVRAWGAPGGRPVLLLHGTPGSRAWRPGPACLAHLERRGVLLVTVSRPGYGLSDRAVDRTVATFAGDVSELVDHLGWSAGFGLIGVSGGGPHALACRGVVDGLRAVGVLSGAGELARSESYAGMVDGSESLWRSAFTPGGALESLIARFGPRLRGADRVAVATKFLSTFPDEDAAMLRAEPDLAAVMVDDLLEGFTGGGWGWLDDARALTTPWQFDPAAAAVPVMWWHGALDRFVPLHCAERAVDDLPNTELIIGHEMTHMGAIELRFNDALDWLLPHLVRPA